MPELIRELLDKVSSPPPIYRRLMPRGTGATSPSSVFIPQDPTPLAREYLEEVREFRVRFVQLDGTDESIRESSRETAAELWRLAATYYEIGKEIAELNDPISQTLSQVIEEIAVELEDMAETEALAGSEEFYQAIKRELEGYIPTSDPTVDA